jgi:hypothetical protein
MHFENIVSTLKWSAGGGGSWADDLAHVVEIRNVHIILAENIKERDHLEVVSIDGRIILSFFWKKQGRMMWAAVVWLWLGTSDGLFWTQ